MNLHHAQKTILREKTARRDGWRTTIALALFLSFFLGTARTLADDVPHISYGGRLVDRNGKPVPGPVDISVRFYGSQKAGNQLGTTRKFTGVQLVDGVFQISLKFTSADSNTIFGDGRQYVYVEVAANGAIYPRQRFDFVPFALRVPIDPQTLKFDSDGQLTLNKVPADRIVGLADALGSSLPDGITVDIPNPGTADAIGIKNSQKISFENAEATPNSITFRAPTGPFTNQSYVWPSVPGTNGQVLSTDGSGNLSWVTSGDGLNDLDQISIVCPVGQVIRSIGGGGWVCAAESAALADAAVTADKLSANAVTTDKIASGAITSDKLAGSIADSKLDTISTPGKVSGGAITSGTIAGTTALDTTGSIAGSGHITLKPSAGAPTELRFVDGDGSNHVGLKAPSNLTSNLVWTLPAAEGTGGYVLSTNGAGALSWVSNTAGSVTSISAGTGLSGGTISSTGTISLADTAVTAGSYTRANITVDQQGRITAASNGAAINLTSSDVTGALPVDKGGTGLATTPSSGQLLIGNGTNYSLANLSQGTNAGVTITNTAGAIALSTVQDIRPTAVPTFAGLTTGTGNVQAASYLAGRNDGTGTPTAGSLRGADGLGNDISGANLTIRAGNGTGTGGSGAIYLQTASAGVSGSTSNTLATRVTVDQRGNVGIGAAADPSAKLDVQGQLRVAAVTASANATSFDFTLGNQQTSLQSGAGSGVVAVTLLGLLSGGVYSLAMQNTQGARYNFSGSGLTYKYLPENGTTVASRDTIYTIVVIGTTAYVSWMSGF